jgi:hypothetical protein
MMKMIEMLSDEETWAEVTFGQVQLHDMRRTRRAVKAASRMAHNASASLPKQMQTHKETQAMYRFLDEEDVCYEALMTPHWQATRARAERQETVLLVQETTQLDVSHRPKMQGLGQVGNQKGRGLLLQTVLAIVPHSREVLGCLMQEPFVRTPAPKGETRSQRRQRTERENAVWTRCVQRIGEASEGTTYVHVGDRGADFFPFFEHCGDSQTQFLIRAAQNRRVETEEEEDISYLLDEVRGWQSQDEQEKELPASHGRKGRHTSLQLSWGAVKVRPPRNEPRRSREPLSLWAIRVWEEQTPEGEEPVEWILLTSVETTSLHQAWERVGWYECRWIVEEYHQCLKTGCHIEERQVQTRDRLQRLLGLIAPLAVRLLWLRDQARRTPDLPISGSVEPAAIKIVAAKAHIAEQGMTMHQFWQGVAQMGGHQGRRLDGPPGWKTLWKGWYDLHMLLEGVQWAQQLQL